MKDSISSSTPTDSSSLSHMELRSSLCPPKMCAGGTINGTDLSMQCEYPRVASPLCGECAVDFIDWGGKWLPCKETRWDMIVLGIFVSYLVVIFFLTNDASSAGMIDILVYFIQTAMLIVGPFASWLSFLSFVNFSSSSTSDCLAPLSPYQQLFISVVMPIILIAELFTIACLHLLFAGLIHCTCFDHIQSPRFIRLRSVVTRVNADRYISCALMLLTFSYTQVSGSCIAFLSCVQVGDASVVFSSPTIYCDTDQTEYKLVRILIICTLLVSIVGFPMISLAYLYGNRSKVKLAVELVAQRTKETAEKSRREIEEQNRKINDLQSAADVNKSLPASPLISSFLCCYGSLFASYNGQSWWWSSLTLIRRTLFTTIDVSLVASPFTKCMAFAFINFYTLCAHMQWQPFVNQQLNRAETASQIILVTISVLLTTNSPPYSLSIQIALFLLIVPLTAFFTILVVHSLRPLVAVMAAKVDFAAQKIRKRLSVITGPGNGEQGRADKSDVATTSRHPTSPSSAPAASHPISPVASYPRKYDRTNGAPTQPNSLKRNSIDVQMNPPSNNHDSSLTQSLPPRFAASNRLLSSLPVRQLATAVTAPPLSPSNLNFTTTTSPTDANSSGHLGTYAARPTVTPVGIHLSLQNSAGIPSTKLKKWRDVRNNLNNNTNRIVTNNTNMMSRADAEQLNSQMSNIVYQTSQYSNEAADDSFSSTASLRVVSPNNPGPQIHPFNQSTSPQSMHLWYI